MSPNEPALPASPRGQMLLRGQERLGSGRIVGVGDENWQWDDIWNLGSKLQVTAYSFISACMQRSAHFSILRLAVADQRKFLGQPNSSACSQAHGGLQHWALWTQPGDITPVCRAW